jgi:superfamily I DNA/RNA helicase/RecB family exonuclease
MTSASFIPTQPPRREFVAGAFPEVEALPVGCVARVLGAPGTGKTSALVARFVALVRQHGFLPQEVLVLSATRESAATLRDRLVLALASGGEYAVEGSLARTAASVAFAIVRHHAIAGGAAGQPAGGRVRLPELISGPEQDSIISQLLAGSAGAAAAELWPAQVPEVTRGLAGFRAELRDLIAACQEVGLSSEGLEQLDPSRKEWVAAAKIFEGYEALMRSAEYLNRFDSPSLVNRAIELLAAGQNIPQFKAVLIDDAQELTPSVTRLVAAISGQGAEVTLFGDPDVSTLGFRQADPGLMAKFAQQVATARGQRPSDVILGVGLGAGRPGLSRVMGKVSSLIGVEGAGPQRKAHVSLGGINKEGFEASSTAPIVKVFMSKQAEIEWLAYTLRKLHLEQGLAWQEMAVVARTRQQLDELERSLAAESVPVRISGAQTALRDEFAARELLELAALVCLNPKVDADLAERLLRSPFCGLDSVSIRRLRRALRRQEITGLADGQLARNSDELLVELFQTPAAAETLRGSDAARVRAFLKSLASAARLVADPQATIEDVLWALWDASGLANSWSEASRGVGEVATQANRNLDAIVALFAAANRFVERNPNGEIAAFVIAQLEQAVPEDSLAFGRQAEQYVQLLTPAALVGRRFQVVAVPQLIEGVWPNLKPRNSLLSANLLVARASGRLPADGGPVRAEMADELRMFYKSLGASEGTVMVTSYFDEDEQVSQFVGLAAGGVIPAEEDFKLTALTLRGMAGSLRRRLSTSQNPAEQAKLAVDLGRLAQAGVPGAHPDDWYGLAQISSTEPLFEFVHETESGSLEDVESSDRGERITINPSQLEAFAKCPLHWFLNYHGASSSDYSASIGTLVHRALELATSVDEAALWESIDSSWHTLKFESAWIEQAERRRAQKMVANLSNYLSQFQLSGGKVLAKEQDFTFNLGSAHIRGKVDRIERTPDGAIMIVDLKTGSKVFSIAEGEANPQLGLYQLAYQNGAFGELESVEQGTKLEGAKLLLVAGNSPVIRSQRSLDQAPDQAAFFTEMVEAAAQGMAMPENLFIARVSNHCDDDSQFGTCQLHLTKAVSYGD